MSNLILLSRIAGAFTAGFSLLLLWAFLSPVAQLPSMPEISDYTWHICLFATLVIPLMTTMPSIA